MMVMGSPWAGVNRWGAMLLGSLVFCSSVWADGGSLRLFEVEPRISVSETYSDGSINSNNSSGGWITSVDPGFSLSRQAARLEADFDYSLGSRYYAEDSHNSIRHRMNGNAQVELIERELFIDALVIKRDQLTSPLGASNIDSGLQRDNLTSTTSWRVGPRWLHRFGRVANSTLEYQVDRVSFDGEAANDSSGKNIRANVQSGSLFDTFFWAMDYTDSDIRYLESDDRSQFEQYSATVGYNLTRKLNVFYVFGNETNRYAGSLGDTGGSYWNVGVGFTPSVRTTMNASFGKRFYGDTSSFSLTHTARKWVVTAAYDETITTIRQQQFGGIFLICPPEIPDCTPEEAVAFGIDIGVRNGTYLLESLTGSVAYSLPKSTLTLSTFDRTRKFQDSSGPSDESSGVTIGWNWKISPLTSLNVGSGWLKYKLQGIPVREDDRWFLRAGMQRELGSDIHASMNYSYQKRDSSAGGSDFSGNTVSASLTKTF